jgi:hypothetical protein
LRGGNFCDVSEQFACRRRGFVLRQARGSSQRLTAASSDACLIQSHQIKFGREKGRG